MNSEHAQSIALEAVAFILGEEGLRDRFMALSGLGVDDLRARLTDLDFLSSILEFLLGHEPDLMAFAAYAEEKPEAIVIAWRSLGGGAGQEW